MILDKLTQIMGLATAKEVREKFDEDIARIILDERRIAFWRFGVPLGAMLGALILLLLIIITQLMRYLYG
jgi:hypothetical protein